MSGDGPVGQEQALSYLLVAEPRRGQSSAVVPIHSHDSTETLLVISGTKQALVPGDHGLEWKDVHAGDYVQIAAARLTLSGTSPQSR